jgi:putative flippase GtrA
MSVFVRYALFAVISAIVNFAAQEATLRLWELSPLPVPAPPLLAALLVGTAAGFAVKYLLDKHLVFHDRSASQGEEARKVALYGLFSVATTALFWSVELGFWIAFGTAEAKYLGGAIGLGLGYAAKFALDRRFVFRPAAP